MRSFLSLCLIFLAAILSVVALTAAIDERSGCVTEICSESHYSALVKRQMISRTLIYRKDLTNAQRLARGLLLKRRTSYAPLKGQATSTAPVYRKDLTNAQRLARGLPLKPPTRRTPAIGSGNPMPSSLTPITYTVVVQAMSGTTSLGYVATDPNFYTPMLNPLISNALQLSFTLPAGATSGSQLELTQDDTRGPLFGLVLGSGTSSDIGLGKYNFLYLDPVSPPGSVPGSVPVSISNYFSTTESLNKQAETSVWSVDLVALTLTAQWINTDGTLPATVFFIQGDSLYSGGDADAFMKWSPSPLTSVTLKIQLV